MNILAAIGALLVGYFLGSISFAVIIGKKHGVDILKEGSGNPGATNVKRVLGKKAGNACFALDALKGFAATLIPQFFVTDENTLAFAIIGLVGAILGHSFSVFIGFKGGKGVAVTMGGLLALAPLVLLCGLLIWVATFYTSRYVSLASIAFGISLPLLALMAGSDWLLIGFFAVLAVLIVVRHKSNIQRLLAGTENRFTKK
ncbi:glycerol-3-phosphate 1-O-acyltransferase PlsY [Cerasicoccus fimbriatus]|uniref:glycerol-3-phosphate 1-O-acyltransferase PlsY n=1 Tax=Cerasicoccus fimbriatus TaxID=3014554 RepID=UPI0022B2B704|nr:glycerol-3-phosphate 1-O-acyltransferase PlsY [Cerasicoccus sp. TK19100]